MDHGSLAKPRDERCGNEPSETHDDSVEAAQISKQSQQVVLLTLVEVVHLVSPEIQTHVLFVFNRGRPRNPLLDLLAVRLLKEM